MHLKRHRRTISAVISCVLFIICFNQLFTNKNDRTDVKEIENDETIFMFIEFKKILDLFNKNDVFLLDIEILKNLKFTELVQSKLLSEYKYAVQSFMELDYLFKNTQYINFGIKIQSFNNFNQVSCFALIFTLLEVFRGTIVFDSGLNILIFHLKAYFQVDYTSI
jgi:hypothetical protein